MPGWDPVTGLGVPNVAAMKTALSALIAANQVFATGTGNVSDISAYTGTYPGGAAALRQRGRVEVAVAIVFTLALTVLMVANW